MPEHDRPHGDAANPDPRQVERGLPMVSKWDPEALAKEKAQLAELQAKPFYKRIGGYVSLGGPGWLQSALTLGGGSAGSSLWAGALLGYSLLWVQPVAMILGIIMMAALAHQTLSTQARPFQAVNRYAHPLLGWGWALASLLASIVWSFPQFSLAGSVVGDMFTMGSDSFPDFIVRAGRAIAGPDATPKQASSDFYGALAAPIIVLITVYVTWNYGKSRRGIRAFETLLKLMVAGIVVCFAVVVWKTGVNWSEFRRGLFGFHVPTKASELGVLIAAFATAVGINMTFLFPYTLLARGWGREHRGFARFDLGTGMFIPFVFATSFIIIAAGNVLHPKFQQARTEIQQDTSLTQERKDDALAKLKGQMRSAVFMAQTLEDAVGKRLSHIVFGLGIIGMTVSSIIMLMLVSAFIMIEVCHAEPHGWAYRVGMLMPAVGMFGPIVWSKLAFWCVVPTSVICFFFLPIAYVSFLVMMNSKRYLGPDRPAGAKRTAWNVAMLLAITVVGAGCIYMIYTIIRSQLAG